jgi:hypothetical protein
MRRVATGIEYGLLAIGAAIVGFATLILVEDTGRDRVAVRTQPAILDAGPVHPVASPETVGSIPAAELRR